MRTILCGILVVFPVWTGGCGDERSDTNSDTNTETSDNTVDADAGSKGGTAWPTGKYITIDEVHHRMDTGDTEMVLLNVVDEEFYNLGHISGSLVIPWDLLNGRIDEVDRSKHIVIYCRKGVRSESAYATLLDADFSAVWIMEGGIEAWSAKGYPTVSDI